jgi:hypothetical protein
MPGEVPGPALIGVRRKGAIFLAPKSESFRIDEAGKKAGTNRMKSIKGGEDGFPGGERKGTATFISRELEKTK